MVDCRNNKTTPPKCRKMCITIWWNVEIVKTHLPNIIFHFISADIAIFCEAGITNMVQNDTNPSSMQISPYFIDNLNILVIFSLSAYFR